MVEELDIEVGELSDMLDMVAGNVMEVVGQEVHVIGEKHAQYAETEKVADIAEERDAKVGAVEDPKEAECGVAAGKLALDVIEELTTEEDTMVSYCKY